VQQKGDVRRHCHLAGLNNGLCFADNLRPFLRNLLQPLAFLFGSERQEIDLAQLIPASIWKSEDGGACASMRAGERPSEGHGLNTYAKTTAFSCPSAWRTACLQRSSSPSSMASLLSITLSMASSVTSAQPNRSFKYLQHVLWQHTKRSKAELRTRVQQ